MSPVPSTDGSGRTALTDYRASQRRRLLLVLTLIALGLAAFSIDLVVGPSSVGLHNTLAALFDTDEVARPIQVIVWQVRLPMSVMALLVGAALALAGAEMQTVLGNPLAEPFTLGVSYSAALGAAVAIVLGLSLPGLPAGWMVSANAFLFAVLSLGAIHVLARWRGASPQTLILFGIAIGLSAEALLSLLQFMASTDALQQLVFWRMGSLVRADAGSTLILAVVLAVSIPFSLAASSRFTLLRLGEERARSLGVDISRLRLGSLLRVGLLSATAVAFVGVIGFVGLVGPHIARLLVGEDHRFLLPASMAVGALVMLVASIVTKLIIPGLLLPVGVVTALIGLPVFFTLVLRTLGKGR